MRRCCGRLRSSVRGRDGERVTSLILLNEVGPDGASWDRDRISLPDRAARKDVGFRLEQGDARRRGVSRPCALIP